jgi:hypothetical protein
MCLLRVGWRKTPQVRPPAITGPGNRNETRDGFNLRYRGVIFSFSLFSFDLLPFPKHRTCVAASQKLDRQTLASLNCTKATMPRRRKRRQGAAGGGGPAPATHLDQEAACSSAEGLPLELLAEIFDYLDAEVHPPPKPPRSPTASTPLQLLVRLGF